MEQRHSVCSHVTERKLSYAGTVVDALDVLLCERPRPWSVLTLPRVRPYSFNHAVGVDVLEIIDLVDMRSSILDAVCKGEVAYVQVWVERKSDAPTSLRLRLVTSGWLAQTCSIRPRNARQRRVQFNPHRELCNDARLEIPEQISRAGRRCDMSKKTMTKAIKGTRVSGREPKDTILGECCQVTEQRHADPTFDGKETNESDALHQERLRLWSEFNKLVTESCTAENHEAGEHELRWNGRSRLIVIGSRKTETASVKRVRVRHDLTTKHTSRSHAL